MDSSEKHELIRIACDIDAILWGFCGDWYSNKERMDILRERIETIRDRLKELHKTEIY